MYEKLTVNNNVHLIKKMSMRTTLSNISKKSELKFDNIWDLILAEEVLKRDSNEISGLDLALIIDTSGKGLDRSRFRNKSKGKSRSG